MIYLITSQKTLTEYPEGIKEATVKDCIDYFKDHEILACDSETEGLDPIVCKLITFQIGDKENQFVIDCKTVNIKLFKELLESKINIYHNAKFDLKFLYKVDIVPKKVCCTYLAECVLHTGDPTYRKSLGHLIYKHFDVELNKEVRGQIHREGLSTKVIRYAAADVEYLHELLEIQKKELKEEELLAVFTLENEMVRVLAYVEFCGFRIDIDKWTQKMKEDETLLRESETKLNTWVSDNLPKYMERVIQLDLFNPNTKPKCAVLWSSSPQVVVVMKDLGIKTSTWDKKLGKMRDSIEESVLFPQKHLSPLIDLFITYQGYAKTVSTYGNNILKQIHADGRLRTQFTQIMNTGRMSSGGGDKKLKKKYTNFQNIPRVPENEKDREKSIYERECFVCSKGNKLVVADYSGQENLVFVNFSLDKKLLEFYDKGHNDLHSFVASKMYKELTNLPLEEIKKNYGEKRYIAKTAGFALLYGGNGVTLSRNLSITKEEGEQIYNDYFTAFPGIKNYFKKIAAEAIKLGYIKHNNILGRKTRIPFYSEFKERLDSMDDNYWAVYREEKKNNSELYKSTLKDEVRKLFQDRGRIERMSYNYRIQGSAADITKIACVKLFKKLEKDNLLFTVLIPSIIHDEIVIECPEDMSDKMSELLKDAMVKAGEYYCKRVPLTAIPIITEIWQH